MKTYYHTQEKRRKALDGPVICTDPEAWLGDGYYFWESEDDAVFWGITKKKRTGEYSIYSAMINEDNVLDTVFNEEQYRAWVGWIDKAAKKFTKSNNEKPTLYELNQFFADKGLYDDVDGIKFQDISKNPNHFWVKAFQYKKRIQLAVFNSAIITNFALHFEGQCT